MTKWTVQVGGDQLVIETTDDGYVDIEILGKTRLHADRETVEEVRLKLGAAIADTRTQS